MGGRGSFVRLTCNGYADVAAGDARDLVWDATGTLYASFLENPAGAIAISDDEGVTWHHSTLPVSGAGPWLLILMFQGGYTSLAAMQRSG